MHGKLRKLLKRKLLAIAIAIVGLVSAAFFQYQGITNTMVAMQSNFTQGRHLNRKRRREEEEERAEHYSNYQNNFVGIVGIIDVTEWITCSTCKWKNLELEKETYKNNTMKTLAVINKHGYFNYADPLAKGLSYVVTCNTTLFTLITLLCCLLQAGSGKKRLFPYRW